MNKTVLPRACCVANCWLSIRTCKAAAPDEGIAKKLMTAIERLDQQSSYRWTTNVEVPAEYRFRPGQTHGTVRGDKTYVLMPLGPRSVHVVIDGDRAAVTNRDGRWEAVLLSDAVPLPRDCPIAIELSLDRNAH